MDEHTVAMLVNNSELSINDKAFCYRVWHAGDDSYKRRLEAINFKGFNNVLDAGCGMGQWLYALSQLNKKIVGLEYDKNRYLFSRTILSELNAKNVEVIQGSIEQMNLANDTFDAIFSYGVVLCTDYRKSLKEFYRVLMPGGKLYFNTNGLGWYLYNLLHTHNDNENFSSREMAKSALDTSMHYYSTGEFKRSKYASVIMPNEIVLSDLKKIGFKNIISAPEGAINLTGVEITPFFKGKYEGYEGVTEYLCEK